MQIVKSIDEKLTEKTLQNLVGKYIYVPTNMVETLNHLEGDKVEEMNCWFAGRVAGYEKGYVHYSYEENEFLDEPVLFYRILLTDGMSYMITTEGELEIQELTADEFTQMVLEHQAKQKIVTPDNKILKPGRDF